MGNQFPRRDRFQTKILFSLYLWIMIEVPRSREAGAYVFAHDVPAWVTSSRSICPPQQIKSPRGRRPLDATLWVLFQTS